MIYRSRFRPTLGRSLFPIIDPKSGNFTGIVTRRDVFNYRSRRFYVGRLGFFGGGSRRRHDHRECLRTP